MSLFREGPCWGGLLFYASRTPTQPAPYVVTCRFVLISGMDGGNGFQESTPSWCPETPADVAARLGGWCEGWGANWVVWRSNEIRLTWHSPQSSRLEQIYIAWAEYKCADSEICLRGSSCLYSYMAWKRNQWKMFRQKWCGISGIKAKVENFVYSQPRSKAFDEGKFISKHLFQDVFGKSLKLYTTAIV